MKTSKQKIAKHIRLYAVGTWGILSLLYIAGEPIDDSMSIGEFFLLKMLGLASLGLCALVGKRLDKAGLLPEIKDEEDCKI